MIAPLCSLMFKAIGHVSFMLWDVFLDSGTCFGFWDVFLDSGTCFWNLESVLSLRATVGLASRPYFTFGNIKLLFSCIHLGCNWQETNKGKRIFRFVLKWSKTAQYVSNVYKRNNSHFEYSTCTSNTILPKLKWRSVILAPDPPCF